MATDNVLKGTYAVKALSMYFLTALLAGRVTLNFQLAFGIFVNYHLWGWFWIQLLWHSPCIYSVKVPTTVLSDWVQVSLPSADGPKIRKDRVVTSISELSGIRGAHMMIILRVMTVTINMIILVAIQMDLHHRKATLLNIQSGKDMVPICLLVLASGFFLVGHFELNMMDAFHSKGHYLGVLALFVGTLGLGFALEWNLFSIFLLVLEFGLAVFWTYYVATVQKKSDDVKIVTRNSKICIGIELFMFYVTNFITVLTVYSCGPNEGNIWASPFLPHRAS